MNEIDGAGSFTFTDCWWEATACMGLLLSILGAFFPLVIWSVYEEYPAYKEFLILMAQAALIGSVFFVVVSFVREEPRFRVAPLEKLSTLGAVLVGVLLSVWLHRVGALADEQILFVTIFLLLLVAVIAVLLFMNRPRRS